MVQSKIVWHSLDPEVLAERVAEANAHEAEEKKKQDEKRARRWFDLWHIRLWQFVSKPAFTRSPKFRALQLREMREKSWKRIELPWKKALAQAGREKARNRT